MRRNTHTTPSPTRLTSQVEHVVVHTQAGRIEDNGRFLGCCLKGDMAGPTASHATDTAAERDKAQGCLGTVSHG